MFVSLTSWNLLPFDLFNKFRHKIKLKAIIEVFKPSKEMQDEILRKPTAISALFLISSANSVLVSVILFGAAILSCIFRFPDVTQSTVGKLPFRVAGVVAGVYFQNSRAFYA